LVCELSEDGTDLLKHVGIVRGYMDVLLYVHFFDIINEYFKQNAWTKYFKVIIGH
jgi:hypothetical protein